MPNARKRAKRKHHQDQSKTGGNLSQAEIWDDSALIRSWNDAVAEYEYYHGIHARGEDVEEVLRKAEMDELDHATSNAEVEVEVEGEGEGEGPVVNETEAEAIAPAGVEVAPSSAKPAPQDDDEPEDGEVDDEANDDEDLVAAKAALVQRVEQDVSMQEDPGRAPRDTDEGKSTQRTSNPIQASSSSIGPTLPQAVSEGPSSDQTIENIKMAYYWAGYYSGLYDGQRQAQAQAPTQPQAPSQPPSTTQMQE